MLSWYEANAPRLEEASYQKVYLKNRQVMFMWLHKLSLQGDWELVSDQVIARSAHAQLCFVFKFYSSDLAEQLSCVCVYVWHVKSCSEGWLLHSDLYQGHGLKCTNEANTHSHIDCNWLFQKRCWQLQHLHSTGCYRIFSTDACAPCGDLLFVAQSRHSQTLM